jgi:hypothetical protein
MPSDLKTALQALKAALLGLRSTGENGFEGLLAEILNEVTKQDFRLANSGLQLGVDGETLTGADNLAFEGKLYSGSINKNEVLSKITSIIASPSPPDLWILCATVELNTQLLVQALPAAEKNGIATLILDWPKASVVPPLAVACGMAAERAAAFLAAQLKDKALAAGAKTALEVIAKDDAFAAASARIAAALALGSLGTPIALERNAQWLNKTFADPHAARMDLGQRLAPFAIWPLPTQPRDDLVASVQAALAGSHDHKIVALLGNEGVGKSWVIAQAWKAAATTSLLIIVPAIDVQRESLTDFDGFVIQRIIAQTQDRADDYTKTRWSNRLHRWRDLPPPEHPRLVLCIDGLNQHSSFDWARWLDGAASKLRAIGGQLVVTDRTAHFNAHLSNVIETTVEPLTVPEWTNEELSIILAEKNVEFASLHRQVLAILRNPRVLGIAFDLLERQSITSFDELSIGRLMFEHIRTGERDGHGPETAAEFSRRLSHHAKEIIDRAQTQRLADQLVFQIGGQKQFELESGLLAVTSERYFRTLGDDETLYQITDDGLLYALGLSIIDRLATARRAGDDLTDTLARLLEPIAALDRTAEAVFNATLIASLDERRAPEISAALQASYVQLQNVSDDTFTTFAAVLRTRPDATIQAIELIAALPGHVARSEWLVHAMRDARTDPGAWASISVALKRWLSLYSLAPELRVYHRRTDDPQKYEADLAASRQRIDEIMASQPKAEQVFLRENMRRDDSADPAKLSNVALEILAGMPLADFARSFVARAYADALNSGMRRVDAGFYALVRFNEKDWSATRKAILSEASFLHQADTSKAGKWALVYLLRSVATIEDALQERTLIEELTADSENFGRWRLVEKHCATDPCDPGSEEPENIGPTAEKFAQLEPGSLSAAEGMTKDDRFLDKALPGLARFKPDAALGTIRRLAQNTAQRTGRPLSRLLVELEAHSAALDAENVATVLAVATEQAGDRDDNEQRNAWIASQYAFLLAFPHLSGDEQLEALRNLPAGNAPMLKLVEVMKPASSAAIEAALEAALAGDRDQKLAMLCFAARPGNTLSPKTVDISGALMNDADAVVRGQAIALAIQLDDATLLQRIVDSGWTADGLDPKERGFEEWYGSRAIIRAAKHGLISVKDAIARINVIAFGLAACELGADAEPWITVRLSIALERTIGAEIGSQAPHAEREIPLRQSVYPPVLTLAHQTKGQEDSLAAQIHRANESLEEFQRRQREAWEVFQRFEAELTEKQARLIVDDVGKHALAAAVSLSPGWGIDTANRLLGAPANKLYRVSNFGLRLARELSAPEPALAKRLVERMSGHDGAVNIVYGPASVPLEAFCVWGAADNPTWDALRAGRLDAAASDHELSIEVLAALLCDKSGFIERYARQKLARPEPAAIARGLMVLGFGEPSEFASGTIAQYEAFEGFLGNAAEKARYAYEREVWSRHWYRLMTEANSPTEFWRWSVLLRKIVDGRFMVWGAQDDMRAVPASLFEASLDPEIDNRIGRWKSHREGNLLGDRAPPRVFLPGAKSNP